MNISDIPDVGSMNFAIRDVHYVEQKWLDTSSNLSLAIEIELK